MSVRVFLTVDAEPDCPPYLDGWRGMEEGAPQLLDLLADRGVPATVFTTGEAAKRYPGFVSRLVEEGHEVGCHGMTHRSFRHLDATEAEEEIRDSSRILREAAEVVSFRAPYLQLPESYLSLLDAYGYRLDSSRGRYKPAHWRPAEYSTLLRVPASMTSSWLRVSPWLRDPVLQALPDPVVLFVHPWEFVDLRDADIPWDCRLGTGPHALRSLASVLELYQASGARFGRMSGLLESGPGDS